MIRAAVAVRGVKAVLRLDGGVEEWRNYALNIGKTGAAAATIRRYRLVVVRGGPGVRPVEPSKKDSTYREFRSGRDGGCLDRDHGSRRKSG